MGETDRNVAYKARPGAVGTEDEFAHGKTIKSCRVGMVNPATNTVHRFESALEGDFATILLARRDVVSIKAQDGPHQYELEGKIRNHMIDVAHVTTDGRIIRTAIKPSGRSVAEVETAMQLLNNQVSRDGRESFELQTDKEITKARVNLASHILHTRNVRNVSHSARVHEALQSRDGTAQIFELAQCLPDLFPAAVFTAVIDLIDRGLVVHHHPAGYEANISYLAWVRAVEKELDHA